MNRTLLFISLFSIFILVSCQSSPKNEAGKQNEVELVAEKQLAFPLDEQTYYLSKSMFQFEENGKEYLHFENTQKSLYDIVIFDIENQQIAKRIPLQVADRKSGYLFTRQVPTGYQLYSAVDLPPILNIY